MELKGKKLNALGDSITEGVGVSCSEKIFFNLIKDKAELAVARNYGISGTRIARQTVPSEEPKFDNDFVKRADEMDADADIIVVFGGTNDYGHGDAAFGTFDSHDVHTFYGALHTLCQKLINKYPDAEIVFMTPLHRLEENKQINEFGIRNVATLSEYVDAIKEVTKYYAIPTLDLYSVSRLQPEVEVLKERYMPDGLHPNDAGAEIIARRLLGFFKSL